MNVLYTDNDPKCCQWLENLVAASQLPPGRIICRDIREFKPADFDGFRQVHHFCGIGGWPYALKLAGWPEDEEVWTASCPCQPWSDSNVWQGGGRGSDDDRHLWPTLFRAVQERRPAIVFGEQVSAAIRKGWLDGAFNDLESIDYACGSAVLPARCVGADHQRKRLFFFAHSSREGWPGHQPKQRFPEPAQTASTIFSDPFIDTRSAVAGDFSHLLPCDGLSVVMERHALKGYGNAIVPQVAAQFIQAAREAIAEL